MCEDWEVLWHYLMSIPGQTFLDGKTDVVCTLGLRWTEEFSLFTLFRCLSGAKWGARGS